MSVSIFTLISSAVFINWHLIWFDYFMFFRKKWFNVWRCWLFGWFHELTWNITRQDNKDSDQKKNIWPEKGEFSNNFKFTMSNCVIWDYIGFTFMLLCVWSWNNFHTKPRICLSLWPLNVSLQDFCYYFPLVLVHNTQSVKLPFMHVMLSGKGMRKVMMRRYVNA